MVFDNTVKSAVLISVIVDLFYGERDIVDVHFLRYLPYVNKSLSILIRERPDENAVDHAEYCSVCAYSEREHSESYQSKSGTFQEHSGAVADIAPERFYKWDPSY